MAKDNGFIIFDNKAAVNEHNRILTERGDHAGKVTSKDVHKMRELATPSEDVSKPWSERERYVQKRIQEGKVLGYSTMVENPAPEQDIDESVFSMDSPGDKNYLYWPYIPDASFEVESEIINKKIGRDKKKLLNEHSGEIKSYNGSAFDAWLNKGF